MKPFILSLMLLASGPTLAALPPDIQNEKDLSVMLRFIRSHERVAATLKVIDLEQKRVYFGRDCQALFSRKETPKRPGWVGPADPLQFDRSTCDLAD